MSAIASHRRSVPGSACGPTKSVTPIATVAAAIAASSSRFFMKPASARALVLQGILLSSRCQPSPFVAVVVAGLQTPSFSVAVFRGGSFGPWAVVGAAFLSTVVFVWSLLGGVLAPLRL